MKKLTESFKKIRIKKIARWLRVIRLVLIVTGILFLLSEGMNYNLLASTWLSDIRIFGFQFEYAAEIILMSSELIEKVKIRLPFIKATT